MWRKLKSHFLRTGGSRNGGVESVCKKSSVNEEYMEAFRTKSYIEIHRKVESQLMNEIPLPSSPSTSSSLPWYIHLSDHGDGGGFHDRCPETLSEIIQNFNLHHLLVDYFQASAEACKICEILLLRIRQTRANYQIIKRIIKLTKELHDDHDEEQYRIISIELSRFSQLTNPLPGPVPFHNIHQICQALLPKLISKSKKTRRRAKLRRLSKKAAAFSLVICYAAVATGLVVLAVHSMVGIVLAPGLMAGCCVGTVRIRRNTTRRGSSSSPLERLGSQLDAAAKGVYYLVKDFDTMSRLVSRLYVEVEHSKAIVDMCLVRNNGGNEMLMEVVKEFHVHDSFFMEQLEELEDHIYLCLLSIKRSRMHVLHEIRDFSFPLMMNSDSVLTR